MTDFFAGVIVVLGVLGSFRVHAGERVRFDFRAGQDLPAPLQFFGPDAKTVATRDAEGLRINLAAGRPNADIVGVEMARRLQGDFEVELGYELLAIAEPTNAKGSGVVFRVVFDSPTRRQAHMSRLRKKGKEWVSAFHIRNKADGKEHWEGPAVPAAANRGKFKLTRTGPQLRYEVMDGGTEFRELWVAELGSEDVASLRFWAVSCYRPIAADVRFTSLSIEEGALPAALAAAPIVELGPAPPRRTALYLGLFVLGLILLAGIGLALLYVVRRRAAGRES